MISLRHVEKSFDSLSVLKNVNLEIRPSEFLSLLGPSGCGKSTILRILAGLEKPTQGERILSQKNLNMSFVFQEAELLSWRNVEENILLPLELSKKKPHPQLVNETLELVKLEKFKKLYPHQLSGGMKMRVSIARALITHPELILMDEPFSALDEITRFELQDQLLSLQKTKKISIVFVTHSINEAAYLSDRIQVFSLKKGCSIYELKIKEGLLRNQDYKNSMVFKDYVTDLSVQMKSAIDVEFIKASHA